MTTIATDGRSMAGESMVSAGDEVVAYEGKIFETPDGRVFGTCGSSEDGQLFAKWMFGEIDRPELTDDFAALILAANGKVYWIGKKLEPVEYMVPQALGSGAGFAIGAMLAGSTPEQAVAIACQRDKHSGGEITVKRIEAYDLPRIREVAA